MKFFDIIALALRNLRQSKLRTFLTVIGVVVGVAAIITMVSFGIGLQQNIIGQAFSRLDAFTAITVIGADSYDLMVLSEGQTILDENEPEPSGDSGQAGSPSGTPNLEENSKRLRRPRRTLNDEAIAEIQKLDGVRFVAPDVVFRGFIRFNDRARFQVIAGATPGNDPRFKTFLAGQGFTSDNGDEVVIKENSLEAFTPESYRNRRNIQGGLWASACR